MGRVTQFEVSMRICISRWFSEEQRRQAHFSNNGPDKSILSVEALHLRIKKNKANDKDDSRDNGWEETN